MPNKNPYLIENKKQVELVQELKDYEIKKSPLSPAARAKVINKSGGNYVSENKEGYGPCSWDNKDCPHYLDFQEGYVALYLSCPAEKCGGDGNQYHWKHAQPCGGRMYISTEANIRCMSCKEKGH